MSEYTKEQEAVTRERDEARADAAGLRQKLDDATAPCHGLGCGRCADCVSLARADAARLREALERMMVWVGLAVFDPERRRAMFEDIKKARVALASTPRAEPTRTDAERWLSDGPEVSGGTLAFHAAPSAEPTPRDMRVAEAVREACVETADASDEASRRVAGDLRDLDLAAVVAKAVNP